VKITFGFLLEQSCDEGVMLAEEFVYERVKDCPREWLAPFETLLQQCPDHVLAYLGATSLFGSAHGQSGQIWQARLAACRWAVYVCRP
jgi:hypothetical protein